MNTIEKIEQLAQGGKVAEACGIAVDNGMLNAGELITENYLRDRTPQWLPEKGTSKA